MERCVNCHYYDRQCGRTLEGKTMRAGLCRRTAPALNPINAKTYMIEGVWPTIRDDDWCGDWRAAVRRVDTKRIADAISNGVPSDHAPSPPRPVNLGASAPPPTPVVSVSAFGANMGVGD